MVEDNILSIMNTIFKERKSYKYVTDEQKINFFFIANRYFSKIYPEQSALLNHKNCDKVSGMDCWYYFMENKSYPKLFWSKSTEKIEKDFTKNDLSILIESLDLTENDCKDFVKYFTEEAKEELKKQKSKK